MRDLRLLINSVRKRNGAQQFDLLNGSLKETQPKRRRDKPDTEDYITPIYEQKK